ncbi:MAG: hypothetical protein JW928_04630 [Candidatus Aureabacteria bacterium]|nr:hypothetical protein [Candidatus Auribacterota bacterium]
MKINRWRERKIWMPSVCLALYFAVTRLTYLIVVSPSEEIPLFCFPPLTGFLLKVIGIIFAAVILFRSVYRLNAPLMDAVDNGIRILGLSAPLFIFAFIFPSFGTLAFLKAFLLLAPVASILLIAEEGLKSFSSSIAKRMPLFKTERSIIKLVLAVGLISFIVISFYRSFYTPFITKEKTTNYLTGDEPSYLLITKSLAKDHDFLLNNNIENKDYLSFFDSPVGGHINRPVREGRMYSKHRIGLPLLLAPFMKAADFLRTAERPIILIFLNLCFACLCMLMFLQAYAESKSLKTALIIWAGLGFSLPLVVYGSQIYPEMTAGIMIFLAFIGISPGIVKYKPSLLIASLATAYLPWLHERFISVTIVLSLMFLFNYWRKWKKVIVFGVPLVISAVLQFSYYQTLYGYILPATNIHEASVNPRGAFLGIVGLLFDSSAGLIPVSPLLLFIIPGALVLIREKRYQHLFFLAVTILSIYVPAGLYTCWHGGFCPLGRYLVSVLPLFVFLLVPGISIMKGRFFRIMLTLFLSYSVFLGFYAYRFMNNLYSHRFILRKIFPQLTELMPFLLDGTPQEMSFQFQRGLFLCAAMFIFFAIAFFLNVSSSKKEKSPAGILILLIMLFFILYARMGFLTSHKKSIYFGKSFFLSKNKESILYPAENIPLIESFQRTFSPIEIFDLSSDKKRKKEQKASFKVEKRSGMDKIEADFVMSRDIYAVYGPNLLDITIDNIDDRRAPPVIIAITYNSNDVILAQHFVDLAKLKSPGKNRIILPFSAAGHPYVNIRISAHKDLAFDICDLRIRQLVRDIINGKDFKRRSLDYSLKAFEMFKKRDRQKAEIYIEKARNLYPGLDNTEIIESSAEMAEVVFHKKPLAVFEEAIGLIAWEAIKHEDSGVLQLKLRWKCIKETGTNYYCFVHFVSDDGKVLFQNDYRIKNNINPTNWWIEGEIIQEEYSVAYDKAFKGMKVYPRIGLWDPLQTKARARITSTDLPTKGSSIIMKEIEL